MRAVTLTPTYAQAGIVFKYSRFGKVVTGERWTPCHDNLINKIATAHQEMSHNLKSLIGQLHEAKADVANSILKDLAIKDNNYLKPVPARFYQADIAKTSNGNPLLVPGSLKSDSLLILFKGNAPNKSKISCRYSHEKTLMRGLTDIHRRQSDNLLCYLDPGDILEFSMHGKDGTQNHSYLKQWQWDGLNLTLETISSRGYTDSNSLKYPAGIQKIYSPLDLEIEKKEKEEYIYRTLSQLSHSKK